ncbi:adenine-specific DNA-methyltransferase [Deinococcus sp. HSC-46F16]|uniref:SNF2-related protein n=1 Tax=Deinococcus sp. HSC-46F16 TaxID=2910968 RepID=UPI00209EB71C|nr:SNF2-related protein [Deinococcus sp. HSC-46F16]MCP2014795.1 adenine-specific DNA-methyltransferase [Deinococcus sp. HSC-46F16]
MSTPYHAQVYAHELTRRVSANDDDKLAGALVDAQVDLNPHQVEAALFAFRSPLSKGALLADEVGLGKTIEAGLVISQKWAEHKRRILIITPANLRKQWVTELDEKFFLPAQILETASFNAAVKGGEVNPFDGPHITVCSYQFAARKKDLLRLTPWDLVVMDEAHRLRNVYRTSNVIGNALKDALDGVPKLLLTATPLQNSLLELYGLVSLIDGTVFGDVASFREQYANLNNPATFQHLKRRLAPLCHRTLRQQVTQYVNYTRRHVLVEEFTPHRDEQALYEQVSAFLQRDTLASLPNSQRTLVTLILRKLLASSSYAIAGALGSIRDRVQAELSRSAPGTLEDDLATDYETLEETAEEWPEDGEALSEGQRAMLTEEVAELEALLLRARSIRQNAKGEALLGGLKRAFEAAERQGASRKAIVFTESRKTQDYLLSLLEGHGYTGKVVLFNGTNTDERSRAVYQKWLTAHQGSDRVSGSRTADMRSALVDEFRDHAEIMIATEAGAEGINLQFCSLVVNYDLPWNPQRIEQRIGRSHRYGQKHDVVVLNFLNKGNEADQRVYELLSEKFKLFEGVFGSSDEVIGAIGSGVDFEKRVADIYQRCRSPQEIQAAFDALQASLSTEINAAMSRTRAQLLENFDEEVREKLRLRQEESREQLTRFTRLLMNLTRIELEGRASFDSESGRSFTLHRPPRDDVAPGRYAVPSRDERLREGGGVGPGEHRYRLGHPLAQHLVEQAKARFLAGEVEHLHFDYGAHTGHIGALRERQGSSGWLSLALYRVEALGQTEEHLLWSAVTDEGELLAPEITQKLFELPARVSPASGTPPPVLQDLREQARTSRREAINRRNLQAFEEAAARIDTWSEDLKIGLEREIKELDRQIKEARRGATTAGTLQAKLDGQRLVQDLEKKRTQKRRSLFDEQDRIDEKRQELIDQLAAKLEEREEMTPLFTIRWSLS